jgi:hypothetical protein
MIPVPYDALLALLAGATGYILAARHQRAAVSRVIERAKRQEEAVAESLQMHRVEVMRQNRLIGAIARQFEDLTAALPEGLPVPNAADDVLRHVFERLESQPPPPSAN